MSWTNLPTDYADAVWEGERKYTINLGGGGTYQNSTITDETPYTPSSADGNYFYGANDANQTNDAINKIVSACGGDINSLKVGIANGGTGATTAAQARQNLDVLKTTQLYYNTSGTTGTIALSSAFSNFRYITVFYKVEDGGRKSETFRVLGGPSAPSVRLNHYRVDGTNIYFKTALSTFSGTTVTTSNNTHLIYENGQWRNTGQSKILIYGIFGHSY